MNAIAAPVRRFNPVFWIMWLIPGATVLAGFATLAIALQDADRPLPLDYHWEGARLDADFARARVAAALGIEVTLDISGGQCRARIRNLATDPSVLDLLLTHGSDAGYDRRVRLRRVGAGEYLGVCTALEAGKWRLLLDDPAADWAMRGTAQGAFASLQLRARRPTGASP